MNDAMTQAPSSRAPRGLGRLASLVREERRLADIAVGSRPRSGSDGGIPSPTPEQSCEMCAREIAEPHQHVVNVESRALKCTCRPCWLLFADTGAGGGRYKGVGTAVRRGDLRMTAAMWNTLDVPVGMLFVFRNSGLDRPVAFYPSPAGATESELDLGSWTDVIDANPWLAEALDDIEGVLLRTLGGPGARGPGQETFEAFVVPIDLCYELVGLVRLHWKGFDGGSAAHGHIDTFFDGLTARASARR